MMQSGWGKAVLIVVALVLIGVGGYHVYKGAAKKFVEELTVSDSCRRHVDRHRGLRRQGAGADRCRNPGGRRDADVRPVEGHRPRRRR